MLDFTIKKTSRYSDRVFKAISCLLPQLEPSVEPPSKDYIKQLYKSNNSFIFIAETKRRKIIGILTVTVYYIPSVKKVWIEDVVVDREYRNIGIGRELLLNAIEFSKTINAGVISLTSKPHRIAANKLYEKIGFNKRETNVYKFHLK